MKGETRLLALVVAAALGGIATGMGVAVVLGLGQNDASFSRNDGYTTANLMSLHDYQGCDWAITRGYDAGHDADEWRTGCRLAVDDQIQRGEHH